MYSLAVVALLAAFALPKVISEISTTKDIEPKDVRNGKSYEYFQRRSYLPSYVIYDGDVSMLSQNRPQISSTRSWHTNFNQRQHQQEHPSESQVYSNLIQINDSPRQKFYDKNYPSVPKFDVVYPYESQRTQYYNEKLPERFPRPFSPNKDFEIRDPTPLPEYPRQDYGFYRTQTVHYGDNVDDRRVSRKQQCNYIRLNEKGFPLGNEMCGRTVSDIILAPDDYPTTGALIVEHRKRYRGVNQRKKRSTEYQGPRCCGDAAGTGYGYYRAPDFGYDTPRPYYYNNNNDDGDDDYGQETSNNNRGLTSYLANRGRGSNEDDESNEDESNRNNNNRNHSRHQQHENRNRNNQNSNNRFRNNRRNYGQDREENQSSSYNRNGGNSYGYMRNDDQNRYRNEGFRNIGGGSFGSYSPYGRYRK